MNDTVEKLEMLANLYAQRDLLPLHKKEAISQALPPEMVKALEDIEAEFSGTNRPWRTTSPPWKPKSKPQ